MNDFFTEIGNPKVQEALKSFRNSAISASQSMYEAACDPNATEAEHNTKLCASEALQSLADGFDSLLEYAAQGTGEVKS